MISNITDLPEPGLIPSQIDPQPAHRIDRRYGSGAFPRSFSLYEYAPYPTSQGATGACAAFASMAFIYTLTGRMFGKKNALRINPWELYAQTRIRMGTFPRDSGSNMRSLMLTLRDTGCVPHSHPHHNVNQVPSQYQGKRYRIPGFESLGQDRSTIIDDLRYVLYVERLPILVGMAMPYVQMMGTAREGGTLQWTGASVSDARVYWHAVTIIGWDQTRFMTTNSYGRDWGLHGFLWPEYGFFEDANWTPDLLTVPLTHA